MIDRIPVTIITGFLGAGKTTILTNLVKDIEEQRFAIIINEFGEVSVDDAILKKHGSAPQIEVHSVSGGLLAYGGDGRFLETMLALKQRRAAFDHVLIETSGLAVPTAIIEVLQSKELKDSFVLDATLQIVDTPHFLSSSFLENKDEKVTALTFSLQDVFQYQLACTDVVVLNKIDELEPDKLLEAESELRRRSPSLRFIELAYRGQLDKSLALGLNLNQSAFHNSDYRVAKFSSAHTHNDGHDHSDLGPHEHGVLTHQHVHDHDPGWVSFVLHSHERQDRLMLEKTLLQTAQDEQILRIKGIVFLKCSKRPAIVQGVRTRIEIFIEELVPSGNGRQMTSHTYGQESGGKHESDHVSELVFIGYHLDRKHVATRLTELTASYWH